MTGPLVLVFVAVSPFIVARIVKWHADRQCATGTHVWAYSGESRTTPAFRRCKQCDLHVARPAFDTEANPINRQIVRTWETNEGGETDHDVRVIGEWSDTPKGYVTAL